MPENFDYVNDIGAFSLQQKRKFYVLLGHNLTVSVRAICWDDNYSEQEKIVGMREINEIMHRLIFRVEELFNISELEEDSWTEADFWALIKDCCFVNEKVLAGNIGWAIKVSRDFCLKQ